MKQWFVVALLLCSPFMAIGQGISISGEIVDDELNRVVGAAAILTSTTDSSQIAGAVSDADGKFQLFCQRRDSVLLHVSHLSYKAISIPLSGVADTMLTIYLEADALSIGEVVVTGRRKTINLMDDGNVSVAIENIPGTIRTIFPTSSRGFPAWRSPEGLLRFTVNPQRSMWTAIDWRV